MYIFMNSTEINTSNRSATVNTPNSSTVFTTSNRSTTTIAPSHRQAVVHTLAAVGFVAIIGAGMWLAVYSTRYVPGVVNRIGSAAVYLGSVFTPAPSPSLSVIPTASTTIPFGDASSTISTSVSSTSTVPAKIPASASKQPVATTPGEKTNQVVQIGGTATVTTPNGLPDFIVLIDAIGYLTTNTTDSFVASSTVPANTRPAVTFTIKNVGTGTTGPWRFSASIPTQTAYIYQSQPQQSLAPGDSIDYTLGFDQANTGANQTVSITANFDRAVTEASYDNNNASAKLTVLGN